MDNMEKVEKLREKADVSYEEAKAVLEECDWDLLDAIVKLEEQGKVQDRKTASYTTNGAADADAPKSPQQVAESYQDYEQNRKQRDGGVWSALWNGIKYLCRKGCENRFLVKKDGAQIMEIPVLLLVVLMVFFFWCLLILMLVSLFFGFGYSFAGPELGKDSVNNVMKKASRMAEDLKTEVREETREKKKDE